MSKPAEKPEVVQLPAEPPVAAPVNSRRAAAQRVREARDRLTSTSGTRPAFDSELLRQYAQTRMSASYVVMLLVVATGLLFGFWMQPVSAAAWTCGMLCIHAAIIRNCARFLARTALARRDPQMANAVRAARSALRPVLDRDPDPPGRPRRGLEHADDVPDAAGDRGVEHAGGQPADRSTGGDRAGHGGDRAEFRAERHLRQLRARVARARRGRLFRAARPSPAFDDAGDAGGARRKGRADRRTRAGQGDIRRGAASRGVRQRREIALPGADEPRTAHAAERDPRIFRGDEERDFRRACGAGLQGIFRRHPQFRRPPAQPHQRDSRSVADRGRPLRTQRGSGVAGACRGRLPSSAETARLQPRHHHPRGVRTGHAADLGRRARDRARSCSICCRTRSSSPRRAARSG